MENPLNYTKNSLNYTKRLLVSVSLLLVLFSGISFAQEASILVSPPTFELELEAGQNYQDEIYLLNKSDSALPIEARVTNFIATDEVGGIGFEDTPLNATNIDTNSHENINGDSSNIIDDGRVNPRKWINIEKPNFILEPKGSERVKFSINVPKEAPLGGYYSIALFESKLPSHYFKEGETKVLPQIGVLFLISVGEKGEANFEIVELKFPEERRIGTLEKLLRSVFNSDNIIVDGSRLPFVLRVKNSDVYHVKPKGYLTILSQEEKILGETEIKETTILPGKIRKYSVEFQPALFGKLDKYLPSFLANFVSDNLYFGKYKLILKLHGSAEVEKEITFWIFPWKGSIILILLAFVILYIIIWKRKKEEFGKENRRKKITAKKKNWDERN